MAKYGIPRQVISGFQLINSLSEEDLKSLIKILDEAKIGDGILTIAEIVEQKTSLDENESKEVIRALFSMVNIYVSSKSSPEEFSEDFISSYKYILDIKDSDLVESLKNNIAKLVPYFKSIKLTSKAKELSVENANNFTEARLISDIRIVYDDDSDMEKREQIALVIHNLRISYSDGGDDDKTFYFTLDLSDLKKLKETIDRALEKDTLIRTKHHELSFVDIN